jgi:hypothetical protein
MSWTLYADLDAQKRFNSCKVVSEEQATNSINLTIGAF